MTGWEVVPPKPTGNRAVLHMKVDILVEVQETDCMQDMVQKAKEDIERRVREGAGFLPFASTAEMVYHNTTVNQLEQRLSIPPSKA